MDYNQNISFPSKVEDVDGNILDIENLSHKYNLILITLKSTQCPICPPALKTINLYGLNDEAEMKAYKANPDPLALFPFNKDLEMNRLLLRTDAFFIVLSPGPASEVAAIRAQSRFSSIPFIVDSDFSITDSICMRLSSNQIWPAILHIVPGPKLRPIHFGRAPRFYGVAPLITYLQSLRDQIEHQALDALHEAGLVMKRLEMKLKSAPIPDYSCSKDTEAWNCILTFCSPKELATLAQTCKFLNGYSQWEIRGRVRALTRKVKSLSPWVEEGKLATHSQLVEYELGLESSSTKKVQRVQISITQLKVATSNLRTLITEYMVLGNKELGC